MKEAETDSGGISHKVQETSGSVAPIADIPEQPKEIAASIVRSSLAEMETQTSNMLNRLENVKSTGPVPQLPPLQRKHSQEPTQHKLSFKGVLGPSKTNSCDVMAKMEKMLAQLDVDDEQGFVLPPLDEASHMAVLHHSTAAYMITLDRSQIAGLVGLLVGETTEWLATMFNFPLFNCNFYREDVECTLHALRLALSHQRTEHGNDPRSGASAAVIYLADMGQLFTVQNACRYLGLSPSCIRFVPSLRADQSSNGIVGQMDISVLERFLEADVAAERHPLMVVATIGSAVTGLSDDLDKLIAICASRRVWLHCQGLGLAGLALSKPTVPDFPNSMTLSLNTWLGLTSVPSVLVYNVPSGACCTLTVFDSDPILSNRISCLSVWSALQTLGGHIIQERIFSAFDSCQELCKMLLQIDGIRVLSKSMFYESSDSYRHFLINAPDYETLFGLAVPVVVFQFDGNTNNRSNTEQIDRPKKSTDDRQGESVAPPADETAAQSPTTQLPAVGDEDIAKTPSNAQYYNRLNNWLGQNLLHHAAQLSLEVIEHELHGTAIRYCPFEPGYGEQLPRATETLAGVASSIEAHIEVMRSTLRHRARFQQLVTESGVLKLIELRDWAGLGGVHYVPEGWESLLNDRTKHELNRLNSALVESLQATDGAFSHGESSDGLICVRFGMVSSETDVEELLELVIHTARVLQESSKILDTMSEILKKGIEAATIDLQREAEEKLWQEGILRQVPLVGRVVNWWSPPVKETGMKGRSLNLAQGVVESTENIYKYHMQMTPKTSNQLPGNKGPPAPLVQKPISADLAVEQQSVQHSRNASSSSELSGGGAAGRSGALLPPATKPRTPASSPAPPSPQPRTSSTVPHNERPMATSTPDGASGDA